MNTLKDLSCFNPTASAYECPEDGPAEKKSLSEDGISINSSQEHSNNDRDTGIGEVDVTVGGGGENAEMESLPPLPVEDTLLCSVEGSQGNGEWMHGVLTDLEKDSNTMSSEASRRMSLGTDILSGIYSGIMEDITVLSLNERPDLTDIAEPRVPAQSKTNAPMRCIHEGLHTKVYRIKKEMHNFGERVGDVALKILSEQFPDETQIGRLENERFLSKKLSGQCAAVRSSFSDTASLIGVGGVETYSIYLEWIPGVTLREWARVQNEKIRGSSVDSGKKDIHESLIRLARQISLSVCKIHETGGIVLNNISSENIIVDDSSKSREDYTVHMIGLGSATLLQDAQHKDSIKCKEDGVQRDLLSLGEVFFELFTGQKPHKRKVDENAPNSLVGEKDSVVISTGDKNGDQSETCKPLRELQSILSMAHTPSQVAAFTLELMGVYALNVTTMSDKYPYKTARNVSEKLLGMILREKKIHPVSLGPDFPEAVGQIHFNPRSLYGRKKQQAELMTAYERVILKKGAREVVAVPGFSGVGKTSFVEQTLRQPIIDEEGHFLHIKFDQLHQAEPLAAILTAFTEFCENVYSPSTLKQLVTVIEGMIGYNGLMILEDLIPTIGKITSRKEASHSINLGGPKSQHQTNFVIQALVRSITGQKTPMIMFFDDVQWADEASLNLIQALIMDHETSLLLFIESYRTNEVTCGNHLFPPHLHALKVNVRLTEIQIDNLNTDDLNSLLSDTIRESQIRTEPLSNIVYRKTGGNVLFAIEFVRSLYKKGLIWFSFYRNAWQWDASLIQAEKLAKDAADVIAQKILHFPSNLQFILKQMACFGSQCEKSTLSLVVNNTLDGSITGAKETSTMPCNLDIAIREGIIEKMGSKYKFAHDQIQCAMYSLIPQSERSSWHMQIGQKIIKQCTEKQLENLLFVVVDQFNRGGPSIVEKSQRVLLSEFNCRAGEKARSAGVFSSASLYLEKGISLLDRSYMKDHYKLWLRLHILYAEVEFCRGNFDKTEGAVGHILSTGRCFDDKLRAYSVLIISLGAQNKQAEAIKMGFAVLEQLGEKFQADSTDPSIVRAELLKTNELLKGQTAESLMNKVMRDKRIITTMDILESVGLMTFYTTSTTFYFVACRMIKLTLNHGLCSGSIFALGGFSTMISSYLGEVESANRYGNIALDIIECTKSQHHIGRAFTGIYGYVFPRTNHLHLCTRPILEAAKDCFNTGDSTFFVNLSTLYATLSFQGGKKLPDIESFLIESEKQAIQFRQKMWQIVLPLKQAILNLMGKSDNPVLLEGEAISFKECLLKSETTQNIQLMSRLWLYQMRVAYLFGDIGLAVQMVRESHGTEAGFYGKFECCEHLFYDGLVCFAQARRTNEDKWKIFAVESMTKMQKWAEDAPCNCEHKLHLLEAEHYFLLGKVKEACERYESAILLSKKHQFIQDLALSYERAAIFYFENKDITKASQYYGNAHSAYIEWGATEKSDHLRKSSPF